MEIYLIRHGETEWNTEKRLQGSTDIMLNENGRKLAAVTGQKLKNVNFDKIYSSPLTRAYETACLIRGERDVPVIKHELLREMCFGTFEGEKSEDILACEDNTFKYFFTQPELYVAPRGGETFEDVIKRGKNFMQYVVEPEADKLERIMIVAHGAINKGIMSYVCGHGVKDYWKGGLQKNCGVIIIKYDENGYEIVCSKGNKSEL